ncbi:sensor histidine kinase [Streptomyces poonensis]|uniref:Histidine kinase n=1 Tax=Streptomyces poonensis TaxID=68255 RepID=A0A918PXR3_9ACTN|nr:sensor histidine kinase [Streptomyces poonensis]GGZ24729.1 histidine kinase [Streptomyces poonensis]GLJ93615.1 histidine kinase [Streptomyces poonensis]
MRGPRTRWREKNTPAKVETYTRWSFHFFSLIEITMIGMAPAGSLPAAYARWVIVLVTAHGLLCSVTASRALDWTRGRREQPMRLLVALGVATGVLGIAALALKTYGPDGVDAGTAAGTVFVGVLGFGAGTVALGVRKRKQVLASVVGFAVGAGLGSLPLGFPGPAALATAVAVLVTAGFLSFTSVFSVWLLNAVYELDEARDTLARLAVAEERLRFGRDLHDVMGRNLAVIALKSELAVQLARRERPEALDQMVEVQRIAQETQSEVRAVVRGYRAADLTAELAGARGVLTAAGIQCAVTGSASGLPQEIQSALGWVVREATTNVLRHGNAVHCSVELRQDADRVVLTVQNDGAPEAAPMGRGHGLAGLRERLSQVDGTLHAAPCAEGLFRVTAEVPLPESHPHGHRAATDEGSPRRAAVDGARPLMNKIATSEVPS